MNTCRYCRKWLKDPCDATRIANRCENKDPDIGFVDLKPTTPGASIKKWRGAFDIPKDEQW